MLLCFYISHAAAITGDGIKMLYTRSGFYDI